MLVLSVRSHLQPIIAAHYTTMLLLEMVFGFLPAGKGGRKPASKAHTLVYINWNDGDPYLS